MTNKYVENINALMKRQESKGLETYGQLLQDNHEMTTIDRIEYLEEELVDALMYLEHLKESVKDANYQNCKFEPTTNADRIRSMTDEELAEFLCRYDACFLCTHRYDSMCRTIHCDEIGLTEKWLQSPVEV